MKYWWIYSTESQKFSKNCSLFYFFIFYFIFIKFYFYKIFILSRSSSNQQKGAYNSVYCVCVSKSKCVGKVAKNGVYHRWIYCDKQETLTTNNQLHLCWAHGLDVGSMWLYTMSHLMLLYTRHCTISNVLYWIIYIWSLRALNRWVFSSMSALLEKKYAATATHHR